MSIFEPAVIKNQMGLKIVDKAKAIPIVESVPGAYLDGSNVIGLPHALGTVLDLAGQKYVRAAIEFYEGESHNVLPPYQTQGIAFMHDKLRQGVLCLDDVGLGKTVQTIGVLGLQDPTLRKVIMCPGFLRSQWKGEIEKWMKILYGRVPEVQVIYPKSDKRSKVMNPKAEFVVAYYLDAQRVVDLMGYQRYILVIDEIHNVRGSKTQRMEAINTMSTFSYGRIGLTASALYNKPTDLFPQLNLVQPRGWGNYGDFARRYAGAQEGEYSLVITGLTNVNELRGRMSEMSFRRVKEDVGEQMPFDTKYQVVWLDPPVGNMSMMGVNSKRGFEGVAEHMRYVAQSKVDAIVEQVKNDGQPCIVFTYLKEQARDIATKIQGSMLETGDNPSSTRLQRIEAYVQKCRALGQIPILVGTMDSLGEGANLQWAKIANIASLDYTPDRLKQVIGRIARMGQTGTVIARMFACKSTMDEHYVKILTGKLRQQFKLDGRKEDAKAKLAEALSPSEQVDILKKMYERLKAQGDET